MDQALTDAATALQGQVDGLEGAYVVGWAAPGADGATRAITVHDETGRRVAAGRASRYRADLVSLRLASADFAFRLPIRHKLAMRRLHVRADDVELHNSPIELGPDRFDSDVTVSHGAVHGWVAARTADFTAPTVTVRLPDGRVVGTARAAVPRPEDPLFAPARFRIPLDQACFGCGPVTLACAVGEHVFARVTAELRLLGSLEILTPERCAGWLFSPDAPARRFTLSITRDDLPPRRHPCEVPRPDVVDTHPELAEPRVGFDLTLPAPADPAALRTVAVRLEGAAHHLFDSPVVAAARPALVRTVRRASQLLHDNPGGLDAPERSLLQALLAGLVADQRARPAGHAVPHRLVAVTAAAVRATIVIPVYRDVAVTSACIDSVLAHTDPARDRILVVDDRSPDRDMAAILDGYTRHPNVVVRHNELNCGFIGSVNRALADPWCEGDVVLLNSDTRVFAGWLDELHRVAHAAPSIGTVTAMSNNATIFSYPHMTRRDETLADIAIDELAALALRENAGLAIDVPTGHGFCLLIKDVVRREVGLLDEGFGRGYGEENDFCARAADRGYRHVAAAGVVVEHRESVSFTGDKTELLRRNLRILEERYPEHSPTIMAFEASEGLRRARWSLDGARLERAGRARRFVVTVLHGLGGGTVKAANDIAAAAGLDRFGALTIRSGRNGTLELHCAEPVVRAVFAPDEAGDLFSILGRLQIALVVVHQTLGFTEEFIAALTGFAAGVDTVFYGHDFYPMCPRVTMIDAVDRFCGLADIPTCERCVAMGGSHEAARLKAGPAEHRTVYDRLLRSVRLVVVPSRDTADYYSRAFPGARVTSIYHPEDLSRAPRAPRRGSADDILVLGAIGPHKGSRELLALARHARITSPGMRFHVIGYTDIDDALLAIGNVSITGPYEAAELGRLIDASGGHLALFLQIWPETYSYTLSEAVSFGLTPLVPDIGAPAERVRAAGFGHVFSFPIAPADLVGRLEAIGRAATDGGEGSPDAFAGLSDTAAVLRASLLDGMTKKPHDPEEDDAEFAAQPSDRRRAPRC